MCTNITIESAGRRHYIRGNTYPHKDALRAAGAHWDGDARAWWLGKRDVAAELAERLSKACGAPKAADSQPASERPADRLTDDAKIVGKARYKGKEYILVWEGTTRRGRAAKLAFADGSRVFWADASEVQVTKRYQSRERYGREQPMTFGRLSRLREEYSDQRKAAADAKLRGETGKYSAQYEASRHDREPNEKIGEATWLRHRKVRLAVVLVGYEPAVHVRGEDAEDMGHYGVRDGWYGVAHYRDATPEFAALQASNPREDGTCVAVGEAVVNALVAAAS